MSYCWKCEEIKEQHKLLNKMLPDDVCKMLGDYEMCGQCTYYIEMNQENIYSGAKEKIQGIVRDARAKDYYCKSIRDFKNIIKRSNHPQMKEMLELLFYKNKKLKLFSSNLINNYLYHLTRGRDNFVQKDFWTEPEKQILREISLILIEFYNTCNKHRINITTTELRNYLTQM